jgi:hypothetical protein
MSGDVFRNPVCLSARYDHMSKWQYVYGSFDRSHWSCRPSDLHLRIRSNVLHDVDVEGCFDNEIPGHVVDLLRVGAVGS